MKNDFRDFYDEEYIMHKAYENSTEEELMHSEWASNLRKYVDKVRTRTGKWKYIYPEDLKKKAENVKRDVSYAARNLRSKVTGQNKTFENKVRTPQPGDGHYFVKLGWERYNNTKRNIQNNYAREQKKGGIGMSKYAERRQKEIEKEKQAKNIKYKQSDYSKVMDKNEKRKKLASYMKAANKGSTYSKLSLSTKEGLKRNLNNGIPDDRNVKITYKPKYSKLYTTYGETPSEKFGKLKTERKQWNDSLKRYRKTTTKEKRLNKK